MWKVILAMLVAANPVLAAERSGSGNPDSTEDNEIRSSSVGSGHDMASWPSDLLFKSHSGDSAPSIDASAARELTRTMRSGHSPSALLPVVRSQQASQRQRSWAGRHPAITGALVGFGMGFAIGMVAGDDGVFDDFVKEFNGLVLGGISAAVGAGIGVGIGELTKPTLTKPTLTKPTP